jgi:hypothetical protein
LSRSVHLLGMLIMRECERLTRDHALPLTRCVGALKPGDSSSRPVDEKVGATPLRLRRGRYTGADACGDDAMAAVTFAKQTVGVA